MAISAATASEVTSLEFKLVMVKLAKALPAPLSPPRKLHRSLVELVSS
jgi:hypothetical protein